MYQVYCDEIPIHDLRSEDLILNSPVVNLGDNDAGSFEFSISPKHPGYDSIRKLKSEIRVLHNGVEVFCGRPTEETKDFYNCKSFYCEGELNYLVDSIQRPAEYHNLTVRGFLDKLLTIHNAQVEDSKNFKVGMVTVTDSNDSIYRYTNYESTLTCINEKLIKRLGGHIRVRKAEGVRYIDYLADYPNTNDQVIEFGKNLLDFSQNINAADIATAVIPLGGKLSESSIPALDERLTIKSVNKDCDFIFSQSAVDNFGWVFKTVTFDDVNVPANLKRKGELYLSDIQFENLVLNCTSVDLNNLNVDISRINILDMVRVISKPHGLDRFFPVTKLTISLESPENDQITLGSEGITSTLTGSSASNNTEIMDKIKSIPSDTRILKEAQENASALITAATHGHVVTTANEQLIMDTDDVETAQKVWRWNLNGLGYSRTGYNGTYSTAITMDGQIVGDRLVGGSVSAEKLDVSYKTSVEKKISDAQDNAEGYTDDQLKSYWTKTEVETAIKNTGDAVLLSAKETATAYTDEKLKNYSTSAQIKVTTDAITSEVNKKLNTSEFSTKIQQSAYSVKIAWNNISKYIQFESGELRIYDSAVQASQKLVSKFNHNGCHFYRDDYYVGKIGTNNLQIDASKKGLNFDLEYTGAYMTWASKDSSSSNAYTMKWTYVQNGKGWGNYTAGELHAGCNINMHGYTLKNVNFEGGGITGTMTFVQVLGVNGEGKVTSWSNNCKLQFKNGILISGTWYS